MPRASVPHAAVAANGERDREGEGPPPACTAGGGKIRGKIGFLGRE